MLKTIQKKIAKHPAIMASLFNLYRPFRGAGIKIRQIDADFRRVQVEMPLTRSNKNIMGTHFGGSLYAMADPFYMYMLMQNLGHRYHVWDQDAFVVFKKPGDGTVYGDYRITAQDLDTITTGAAGGSKVLHAFEADITKADGTVVASVRKLLYIRLKKQFRPQPPVNTQ
ncbi:DUF4442 domain-containing protein [Limnobacter litoralis]|uniref:DUF4442 domain-containing protein n=1 Tax=Limnobacter litoralis TaxID=481366 RepID=A0ABQ5YSY3_9BURK|nr:DUF4442 domain-containing protein [Limnobacter litoralis]GLR27755.1 DUF4442 domain-containing protein [Limnobacter litoralis]